MPNISEIRTHPKTLLLATSMLILGWWLRSFSGPLNLLGEFFVYAVVAFSFGFFVYPQVVDAGRKWIRVTTDLTLSLLFAYVVFHEYSGIFYDDAGFILRYLDNFAKGCFYCYNLSDGAVFGTSSFIYGLLGGFLAWLGVKPELVLHGLGFTGLVVDGYLLLLILRKLIRQPGWSFVIWVTAISTSKTYLEVATSGMESPVHFALILAAFWFFLRGNARLMWLMMAVSVISKLDAVPIVLVLGGLHLLRHRNEVREAGLESKTVKDVLIFGVIPVICWIVFATWLFGSPLPQSAYAKIYFHSHPSDHWFPFLKHYTDGGIRYTMFCIFGMVVPLHIWINLRRQKGWQGWNELAPGLCADPLLLL